MRRVLIITTAALITAGVAYFALAGEPMGGMTGKGMMERRGMMQKEMMGRGMMDTNDMPWGRGGMHPMAGMICNSSLAATEDGGAIVMMGNKLMKYDKDLNLVKEVEIKIDWEKMHKAWKEAHKKMMSE